jgi:hypothetical protein
MLCFSQNMVNMCIVHHILKGESFMRKFLRVICSSLLVLAMCVPVYAAQGQALPVGMAGQIIAQGDGNITVQNAQGSTVVLNITPETIIVDAATGMSVGLDMRMDNNVTVFYGPISTRSMPPISNAVGIALNVTEPGAGLSFYYGVVEQVASRTAESVTLLGGNGRLAVTINRSSQIMPYLTRNLVSIDNIDVGTALLVCTGPMALSFPAQTTAKWTVVVGQTYGGAAAGTASSDQWPGEGSEYTGMMSNTLLPFRHVPNHPDSYYYVTD